MIVELKMIKAHIICKESNKIASCNPVLKPHTKYDSSYDFWVFKSIQNALESRPLEKGEHIMAVMVNEDYYSKFHLNNFFIMSEEELEPRTRYEMRINAYESPYELIHNLPEEEPKEYHFYEIKEVSTEESIRIENSFRSERPKHYTTKSFEVVENDDIFDTELYNYHREAPEWFQYHHMTLVSGKYAPLYVNDIGHIPIEISAMAVKALNIPAAIHQVKEGGDVIYNDDIVYKIVTNDTDEIRDAILTNPTLYDTKNLVRRVVDILCNDKCKRIERAALKIKKNGYKFIDEVLKFDPWMR